MVTVPINEVNHLIRFVDFRLESSHKEKLASLYRTAKVTTFVEKTRYLTRQMGHTWYEGMDLRSLEKQYAYIHL